MVLLLSRFQAVPGLACVFAFARSSAAQLWPGSSSGGFRKLIACCFPFLADRTLARRRARPRWARSAATRPRGPTPACRCVSAFPGSRSALPCCLRACVLDNPRSVSACRLNFDPHLSHRQPNLALCQPRSHLVSACFRSVLQCTIPVGSGKGYNVSLTYAFLVAMYSCAMCCFTAFHVAPLTCRLMRDVVPAHSAATSPLFCPSPPLARLMILA